MNGRCVLALSLVLGIASAPAEEAAQIAAAEVAALGWLELTDRALYERSWNEASVLFRAAVAKEDWVPALRAVRRPLGDLKSRRMQSSTYATSLPGAPAGEYVVFRFRSDFGRETAIVDTVSMMKQSDELWRVAGYYIR